MVELRMKTDGHLGGYIEGGDPSTWCPRLWAWIVDRYAIHSVLDVGCGEGHSTKAFRDLGCEVVGVDGCQQAIDDSVVPDCMVRHDFRDGPFLAKRRFDLIWSCEFLEHVEPQYLPHLLATFAQAEKLALVTHAFPGQRGHHHVNCQPSTYWIKHFETVGFDCQVGLSARARALALRGVRQPNHFARSGLAFWRRPGTSTSPIATSLRNDRPQLSAVAKSLVISRAASLDRAWKRLRRVA
jgi:SAM-dependent methyltransferase